MISRFRKVALPSRKPSQRDDWYIVSRKLRTLDVPKEVENVEQGALMSPNPRGMLEDLVVGYVCVFSSL